MISQGYKISIEEEDEMREFRNSAAYGTYLKAISGSPAFAAIMREHIQNVNIADDVRLLKTEGKLPDGVSTKALNELFKQSLSKMAIGLVADTVILKELEDAKMAEVIHDLKKDSDVVYLLGEADQKYYTQAAKMLEQGKIDQESAAFRGLVAFMKKYNKEVENLATEALGTQTIQPLKKEKETTIKDTSPMPDFDSNNITL